MEIQLQELIEQIKKDGVEAAEAEAKAIIEKAKADAQRIVDEAQEQADKMVADAKAENERMVRSSEEAIRQAGRNLLISFRESVTREVKAIVAENVNAVYSSEALAKLIVKLVENWASDPEAENISVILNDKELSDIESCVLAELKAKTLKGITLRASNNFEGGFRIAVNEGGAYYDYSSEAVIDMISNYLSPRVVEILKEA